MKSAVLNALDAWATASIPFLLLLRPSIPDRTGLTALIERVGMRISHGAVPASLCPTRYAIDVGDLSHDCFNDVFNQDKKVRRNKIRLHDWSVKEHPERGSDLISSGYGSVDLPINLSLNGFDSVSRHGKRSSTAFDLECLIDR